MNTAVMPELITDLSQITPDWLTHVLRQAECLGEDRVTSIQYKSDITSFNVIAWLQVSYMGDTRAPRRFFLKFSKPDWPVTIPENGFEVQFYKSVGPKMRAALIPRCYDAVFSIMDQRAHLLLEDLSETHFNEPPSHLPPLPMYCEMIVDALAEIHAAWWDDPPGEVIGMSVPGPVEIAARIGDVAKRIDAFRRYLGERLSPQRHKTYDHVLKGLPNLYQRLISRQGYTVVHDDIHIGNVLYPRNPVSDTIRLIDWQTWLIDLAAKDLAHMMVLFWFPDYRAAHEQPLLRRYHAGLVRHGIKGYSWEQLWYDYRLCAIRMLFHPAWQWSTGHHPNIWWNHLERAMAAYSDLQCAELLEV